jgi:hypothetical protein
LLSFSTKNEKRPSSFFPPNRPKQQTNNNKKGFGTFFHNSHEEATERAAAEEQIEMMMTRCVVYSCFDEISFVSFCTLLFRYFNAFPSKFLKIKLTILNLLFSQQWRTGDASPGGRFTTTALSFLLSKE